MTKRFFQEPESSPLGGPIASLLKKFKSDDLILLGLILFLMKEDCEDKELLLLLGYLFVTG
ncbi:MAG: hypothetical protein Q8882_02870 [Bacillota bacterium]|nr:hypothetical protein [Bacillota bacterium]